ncbi:unnamed protein product [Rhizophagus irregularis]|uniref:CCHC-type domain-containing protein n=1 Tax=Rhizophagus irregularis TaxID=588596 RepID=A0A2I1H9E7_9GLOM|nr:hypothetical protein RhiirA4_475008 [Rhizophagus irregularis]CAB4418298.1 unnamed protein product [Rhizophagus irregularis]
MNEITDLNENDEEIRENAIKRIRKILNKCGIQMTEDEVMGTIRWGFTKYVFQIKFYDNIRLQESKETERLSQLVETVRNIRKKNHICWVCNKKGHYMKECLEDQK